MNIENLLKTMKTLTSAANIRDTALAKIHEEHGENAAKFVKESCALYARVQTIRSRYAPQEHAFLFDQLTDIGADMTLLLADRFEIPFDDVKVYLNMAQAIVVDIANAISNDIAPDIAPSFPESADDSEPPAIVH